MNLGGAQHCWDVAGVGGWGGLRYARQRGGMRKSTTGDRLFHPVFILTE